MAHPLLKKMWREKEGYLYIAPLMIFVGVFVFYPIIYTFIITTMRYEFLRPDRREFIGLANYVEWFKDPAVWETGGNTLHFLAIYIPIHIVYGLILALLTHSLINKKATTVYRSLLYLPVVLPMPIVAVAWKWMYDPTLGVFNHLLIDVLGINWQHPGWLSDAGFALQAISIMSIWQFSGWIMMLFLVGLNNIPNELYEAARIDGSNAIKSFFRITLPLLKPTFFVIIIMRLSVLGITVEPLIMTEGGPNRATMTYGLQAYYTAFRWGNWRIGYASTWYVMLALIATVLGVIAWKVLKSDDVT